MMEFMQLFIAQGWRVAFASTAADSDFMADLSDYDVERIAIAVNSDSFDTQLKRLQPDLVLFDRFIMEEQFGWRVEKICPQAIRVIETIDLHCLREARHAQFKCQPGVVTAVAQHDLYNAIALREIAAIFRSDLSIMVSDAEMTLLNNVFNVPEQLLHLCPFMFDVSRMDRPLPSMHERCHFTTIGNFRHAPNWDAVLWLQQQIWPLIRAALPDAELHIYGSYAPPKATALHRPETGFHVLGRAADVGNVMQQARVCLAPLRFGAGIKTKLADAMYHGTPNVCTSIGAEGMRRKLDWSGSIADEAESFARASVSLYTDAARWQQAQANGFNIMRQHFNAASNGAALICRLQTLKEDLAAQRQQNFIGQMLRHHHQRSTEFMSRWIACKQQAQKETPTG